MIIIDGVLLKVTPLACGYLFRLHSPFVKYTHESAITVNADFF